MKYQILTYNQISAHGLHRFPSARFTVGKSVDHPDAIVLRSHDLRSTPIPSSVKAIGRAGSGTNNIPVADMSKRGVPVFNAPGANANAVKELVFAALLMAARNVVPALRYVTSLDAGAADLEQRVEEGKKSYAGVELHGKTLGIIGLGAIGCLVADTAIKLGMKVTGFDPEITVDAAWRLPSSVRRAHSIEDVLKHADFATLHVPLLPVTRHLIDEKRLARPSERRHHLVHEPTRHPGGPLLGTPAGLRDGAVGVAVDEDVDAATNPGRTQRRPH